MKNIPEISQSIMLFSDPRDRTKCGGEHTYSSKDKKNSKIKPYLHYAN
jgi:hypothetical protein